MKVLKKEEVQKVSGGMIWRGRRESQNVRISTSQTNRFSWRHPGSQPRTKFW